MAYISGAVEGPSDESVFRRLVEAGGGVVHRLQVQHGKPNLRRALPGYNQAARVSPWLVLVDLDHEFGCPPDLVSAWLPTPSRHMRFRVVVRQIEAWLLADAERFASFFSVHKGAVPIAPDTLPDPKASLLAIVSRSRRSAIRQDMTPRHGSGRRVGPAYTSRLIEFASDPVGGWRWEIALTRSPSLAKCVVRLNEIINRAPNYP